MKSHLIQPQREPVSNVNAYLVFFKIMVTLTASLIALLMFAYCTYGQVKTTVPIIKSEDIEGLPAMPYLKSFTVKYFENNVYLKWLVRGQTEDCIYMVERSTDKMNFFLIGSKAGIGCAPEPAILYCFTDTLPTAGISWYRLKRLAMDLSVSVSACVELITLPLDKNISAEQTRQFGLSPVPAGVTY